MSDRRPDGVVAVRAAQPIASAAFRASVAINARRIAATGCRRGVLVTHDAYWGAVGLLALVHAGIECVLPPNGRADALAALARDGDLIVCDLPPGPVPWLMLEQGEPDAKLALSDSDPAGLITFFTSGSSGTPKRVEKTLAHIEREVAAIDRLLGRAVSDDARVFATVPHQHAYGLAFRVCWPLATGRPFGAETHDVWESALKCLMLGSVLVTSPAHLARMEGLKPLPPERRPSLVLSAGAALSDAAAAQSAAVLGIAVTEIFGSTETGAIAYRVRDRADPPWRPLPGVAIGSTADGLLHVRAAHVPEGEHNGADRVAIDGAGGIHFLGRSDRVVKIEGSRVSLTELEARLRALQWVADAAVVALGSPSHELGAAVVPNALGRDRLGATGEFRFSRHLRKALANHHDAPSLPRRWRFTDRLPEGAMGKSSAAAIAALFDGESRVDRTEPEIKAVRQTAGGAELDLYIDPGIVYLEGHFPRMPVVPAIAQIHWAIAFANRHMGVRIEAGQAFQVKFRRMMMPSTAVTLSLRAASRPERLIFEYRGGEGIMSSGSIAVAPGRPVADGQSEVS